MCLVVPNFPFIGVCFFYFRDGSTSGPVSKTLGVSLSSFSSLVMVWTLLLATPTVTNSPWAARYSPGGVIFTKTRTFTVVGGRLCLGAPRTCPAARLGSPIASPLI